MTLWAYWRASTGGSCVFFARHSGRYFEGLAQAARWHRQHGNLGSPMVKKLVNIDAASHVVRHLTRPRAAFFVKDVAA